MNLKSDELKCLNSKISSIARTEQKERNVPLLSLALDPILYPDTIHEQLKHQSLDPRLPWLNSLYWVRSFYQEASGRNYIKVIDPSAGGLGNSDTCVRIFNLIVQPQAKRHGFEGLIDLEKFKAECWIIGQEAAGEASNLMRGTRFLLKRLHPAFTDEEFDAAISELEGESFASKGQLISARIYRSYFCNVLKALFSGTSEGWLEVFKNHALHQEANLPVWGIYTNGDVRSLGLRIRSSEEYCEITQNDKNVSHAPHRGEIIFPSAMLENAGLSYQQPIQVRGKSVAPPSLDSIRIARISRKVDFHQFLDTDTTEIQAAELWAVLLRSRTGDFLLGENQVPRQEYQLRGSPTHRLVRLNLGEIDRSHPLPLTFDGEYIVSVGAAPRLRAVASEEHIRFHDEPLTWVVFGDSTEIELDDYYGDRNDVVWKGCEDCDGRIYLLKEEWGRKSFVRAKIPGRSYDFSIAVVFLPPELRDAMLVETSFITQDIKWEPETSSDRLRARIQSCGLCPGTLLIGGAEHRLSVPSAKTHFWIRQGINSILAYNTTISLEPHDFERYSVVELYLPEGSHEVTWGEEVWFCGEGPSYFEFKLSELPNNKTGDGFTRMTLESRPLIGAPTLILTFDPPPLLSFEANETCLQFPGHFDATDWHCALIIEGVLGGRVLIKEPCNKLGFEESENGTTRIKLPQVNPHPDQGAAWFFWKATDDQNLDHEWLKGLQTKPGKDFFGPLVLQTPNPFRSRSEFQHEIGNITPDEFPLEPWIKPQIICPRHDLSASTLVWEEFLESDFIVTNLSKNLDERIRWGDNWFAATDWGGAELASRLDEIEKAYLTDPNGNLRRSKEIPLPWNNLKKEHRILHGLHTIKEGKKPAEVWLPLGAFGVQCRLWGNHGFHELNTLSKTFCKLADSPNKKRSIRFCYGGGVSFKYEDTHELTCLLSEYRKNPVGADGQLPRWWIDIPDGEIGNFSRNEWQGGIGSIAAIFSLTMADFRNNFGDLTNLFSAICRWMEADGRFHPERVMIFQVAVLCRTFAWSPEKPHDAREMDILRTFTAKAWVIPEARSILTNDLLSVDWALAWFRFSV